jgi:hypothetical protein
VLALSVPEVPFSVTVELPIVAVELAAKLMLVPVVIAVPNEAVTPAGSPVTLTDTVPAKPFTAARLSVPLALEPRVTPRLVGTNASVNPGAVTVTDTVVVAFSVPEVPVTVTEYVPAAAVLLAAKVSLLEVVVVAGLKLAVRPEGNVPTVNATLPLKPFTPVTVIVLLAELDRGTVKLAGEVASVNPGATTVSVIVVVLLNVPEVPVIFTGYVPTVAVAFAVKVRVAVVFVLVALSTAVTPLGSPLSARLTVPLKPFCGATVIVLLPLPACFTVSAAGELDSVKDAVGAAVAVAVRSLIRCWPAGDPQPVVRSYPVTALKPESFPLRISLKSAL